MSRKINLKGVVPEDTHAQLMKGHWKYHGGGVSKAKGLIFQRGSLGRKGGGVETKKPFSSSVPAWRGVCFVSCNNSNLLDFIKLKKITMEYCFSFFSWPWPQRW